MRKSVLFYIIVFILVAGVVLFLDKTYRETQKYSDLTNRHNLVYSYFQNLSRYIHNAAILTPDLVETYNTIDNEKLFFVDSSLILQQLSLLRSTVQDSVNIRIIGELEPVIKSELYWLLASNVPDSLIKHQALAHTALFKKMDALINQGMERANFLIKYLKAQLNHEINTARLWTLVFISLASILLVYVTANMFRQQSQRIKKEKELLQSLKEVADYKYALNESSIVAITDQKGIIKYANENFCKISKYKADELIGQDHRIINSGHHSKDFIKDLWRTIANGKIWKGELKNKAKDGTIYWVDTTIVPFLDEKGKPYQYIAIRADITTRKEAEENLQKSLKEIADYKYALDESSIIAITDQKGIIKHVNDNFCKISKYSRNELIGQDHRIINSGYHPKEFIRQLWITIANGKIWKGELKNKAKDDTIYWVDTTIVPLLNDNGKPHHYLAIRADITERKQVENEISKLNAELEEKVIRRTAELQAVNKEMESFTYSVSHDLRAPLRAINGYAEILEEDYTTVLDDEGKRLLAAIETNARNMGMLIDDLLTFSRLGRKEVQKTTVHMKMLVENVLSDINKIPAHNATIQVGELHPIEADPTLISQVFINLFSNAIKYSSKENEPVIRIQSEMNAKEVIYSVQDNGVGFDMKYAHKLFGVFQRLHHKDEFEGTGVGLAIIERIITRHGGRVWAEASPGKGATFFFSLPVNNN